MILSAWPYDLDSAFTALFMVFVGSHLVGRLGARLRLHTMVVLVAGQRT
jgi:hypothetical protein